VFRPALRTIDTLRYPHPNIRTVYEIDEADGYTFITMAYVAGQSLREKTGSGPLKLEEALSLATDVARDLQEAHEKDLSTSDIKSCKQGGFSGPTGFPESDILVGHRGDTCYLMLTQRIALSHSSPHNPSLLVRHFRANSPSLKRVGTLPLRKTEQSR